MPGDASTRSSKMIKVSRQRVYQAFLDPEELVAWLPPADMTGKIHAFDARVGRGYCMSLFYPPEETSFRGKTAEREDMVEVRFVELVPPEKIVEAITFVSPDPAFAGEMRMTATFDETPQGTLVTLLFENLPPVLRPQDNEEGAQLSLDQLARYLESKSRAARVTAPSRP
jgi:uncharacterized protein YndB with AHSA1/START domain